jgi:hypothetical protein
MMTCHVLWLSQDVALGLKTHRQVTSTAPHLQNRPMPQQHNGVYNEPSIIHTLSSEIWDVILGYARQPPDMNSLEDLRAHGRFVNDRTLND